jgi:NAD(P) transhydrogenase subunit alpha
VRLFIPRETSEGETRVPLLPAGVAEIAGLGAVVEIEAGLGSTIRVPDNDYARGGATVAEDGHAAWARADMVLKLNPPSADELPRFKEGCILVSFVRPFRDPAGVAALAAKGITTIAMEMIPRTTLAQKMDALSSQASLSGYVAVILAAERCGRVMPMMMTPAGTIPPARVFVIGAGVAGLQAVATAKRLGARVDAYDTRPAAAEQVRSLGGRFLEIDLGDTGETRDGYAKPLGEEQLRRQREVMARHCAESDVIIATAQVFGKPAPHILTAEMVRGMKPGSIIVDCAMESGGNVEVSEPDREVEIGGVRVIGTVHLTRVIPRHASQMYSSNLVSLVSHFWDDEAKAFRLNREDEIMQGCLLTHDGEVVNEVIRQKALQAERGP